MNGTFEVDAGEGGWRREIAILASFSALFLGLFYLPVGVPRFDNALKEGLELTKWYAREHVLLCSLACWCSAASWEQRRPPSMWRWSSSWQLSPGCSTERCFQTNKQ